MKKERLIGLDILRILSAFIVFLFHSNINFSCNYGVFTNFISMGAIFMTAFFMLSGFSLLLSYRNTNIVHIHLLKKFYIKRLISLIPLYYVLILYVIVTAGINGIPITGKLFPIEILGLQSIFSTLFPYTHNGGTWFISCILICYLFYPLIQEILKQIKFKSKIILLILCVFILLYSPFIVRWFHTDSIYTNPFLRGLEFLIGTILASIYDDIKLPHVFYTWFAFCVEFATLIVSVTLAVRLNIGISIYKDYMLYNWIGLPIFILMMLTLSKIKQKRTHNKVIIYLSSISYAFYIAQFFTWKTSNVILSMIGRDNNYIRIAIVFCVVLVYTILLHELIEKPMAKILLRGGQN